MSRIGKKPIEVPEGVKAEIRGNEIEIRGPKGTLSWAVHPRVTVGVEKGRVLVSRKGEEKLDRALHGTTRAVLATFVQGVSKGYEKRLEIVGVGYQAKVQGRTLSLNVGFSHLVELPIPEKVTVTCPDPTHIILQSCDKQGLGHFAAVIRGIKPPEPYKGKGIRYFGELVKRKAGKSFVSGGAGGG